MAEKPKETKEENKQLPIHNSLLTQSRNTCQRFFRIKTKKTKTHSPTPAIIKGFYERSLKMKKKFVLASVMLLFLVGGCWESFALIGGGAAGGMTVSRIIQQQKEANQANIDLMEQQKTDLEAELAEATDEAEKERIQEQLDNTNTVLADLRVQKITLEGLEAGLKTDWSDPQAVIPVVTTILMAVLAERERRRKKKATTALTEVVAGGQQFKNTSDSEVVKDFKKAMNDKQSADTKKMVAVIRV